MLPLIPALHVWQDYLARVVLNAFAAAFKASAACAGNLALSLRPPRASSPQTSRQDPGRHRWPSPQITAGAGGIPRPTEEELTSLLALGPSEESGGEKRAQELCPSEKPELRRPSPSQGLATLSTFQKEPWCFFVKGAHFSPRSLWGTGKEQEAPSDSMLLTSLRPAQLSPTAGRLTGWRVSVVRSFYSCLSESTKAAPWSPQRLSPLNPRRPQGPFCSCSHPRRIPRPLGLPFVMLLACLGNARSPAGRTVESRLLSPSQSDIGNHPRQPPGTQPPTVSHLPPFQGTPSTPSSGCPEAHHVT